MAKFTRDVHTVDGVKTVVHTAGTGDPLITATQCGRISFRS